MEQPTSKSTDDATEEIVPGKFVLKAGACLWSLGKLSEQMQIDPNVIMQVTAHLKLQPLSIDGVPFLLGDQAELVREFVVKTRERLGITEEA